VVGSVHGTVDRCLGQCTVDQGLWPWQWLIGAHAPRQFRPQGLATVEGKGRGEHDDADGMLTGAREAVMRWRDSGEAWAPNDDGVNTIEG
jgi:hypothetical protein